MSEVNISDKFRLSICIPTLNRGDFIGETLKSIVSQLEEDVEIIIVDGGSIDNTQCVVKCYQSAYPNIHYVKKNSIKKEPSNEGFDRDCNYSIELARGRYCWLMTDDDLLMPGAVKKILKFIGDDFGVIVTSVQIKNIDLSSTLIYQRPVIGSDQVFNPNDWDKFAITLGNHLTFVGAFVVKRELWLSRDRKKFFGSGFIHIGVLFSEKIAQDALIISEPLVSLRYGNAQWTSRAFEIWMFNWPELIWSFSTILDSTKQILTAKDPWKNPKTLLMYRALGVYSKREYRFFLKSRIHTISQKIVAKMISVFPRVLIWIFLFIYIYVRRPPGSELTLVDLKNSFPTFAKLN